MGTNYRSTTVANTDETEGDFWRDVRKAGQQARASNRVTSAEVLTKAGIRFTSHNDGAHLRVLYDGRIYDFWPGTGLWRLSGGKGASGRGVFKLLRHLGGGAK
jgi:hypothetical protein